MKPDGPAAATPRVPRPAGPPDPLHGQGHGQRVMYPAAMAAPDRRLARRARIMVDDDYVTVVGRNGRVVRTFAIGGDGGIVRAVHVPSTQRPPRSRRVRWRGSGRRPAVDDLAGSIDFLDAGDRVRLSVPLALWYPGLGQHPVEVTGAGPHELAFRYAQSVFRFSEDRLPVETVRERTDPRLGNRAGAYRADLRSRPPEWLLIATFFLPVVAFVLAVAVASGPSSGVALPSAALALTCPVALHGQRLWTWLRDRSGREPPVTELRPSPVGPSTRRFRHSAGVRVFGDDVCVTNAAGAQVWLPKGSPGLRSLVVVTDPDAGAPAFVRLVARGNMTLGCLPWAAWFGGLPESGSDSARAQSDEARAVAGRERLVRFASQVNLEVVETQTRDELLSGAAGAELFRPLPARRRNDRFGELPDSRWNHLVLFLAAAFGVAAGSLSSDASDARRLTLLSLGVLTAVAATAPDVVRRCWRDLWWDRLRRERPSAGAPARWDGPVGAVSRDEVVLSPTAQPFPARAAARTLRVVVRDGEVVVRRRGRADQAFPVAHDGPDGTVGPGGVVAAVGVGSVGGTDLANSPDVTLLRYCGYLVSTSPVDAVRSTESSLRDNSSPVHVLGGATTALASLPLEYWTPGRRPPPSRAAARERGSTAAPGRSTAPATLLADSGLKAAFDRAGVPIRSVVRIDGLEPYEWTVLERVRPFVAGPDLPRWILAVRLGVLPVATLAAIVTTALVPSALGWAAVAIAVPLLSWYQLGLLGLRDRRSRRTFDAVVRPRPAAGVAVTRRFLAKARVAVSGSEIVFVDGLGAEQWHPLTGLSAVSRCQFLVDRSRRTVLEARFSTANGQVVAVLPATDWWGVTGGTGGTRPTEVPSEVRRLLERAGIVARERLVAGKPDRATGLVTAVDDGKSGRVPPGARLEPVPWRQAHRQLRRRPGMPDAAQDGYSVGVALFALLLAVPGGLEVADTATGRTASLVLSSLAVVLWLGLYGGRRTARRLWFDRARRRSP